MSVAKWYRKKPVVFNAIQYDGTAQSGTAIVNWALVYGQTIRYWCNGNCVGDGECEHVLRISTLEGTMTANSGDWVIRGVQGEFYPCKPDIFEQTYEAA